MKSDPYAGEMYDAMQADLLKYCRKWVFPSSGAADALFETGSKRMKTLHESCEIKVVHSGYQSHNSEGIPCIRLQRLLHPSHCDRFR